MTLKNLSKNEIVEMLSLTNKDDVENLRQKAFDTATENLGPNVYYRGIVEFSNICALDCKYCGIRKGNKDVDRYWLTEEEVVETALWCADAGYGSTVLQSGERFDSKFVNFVESCVAKIKKGSISENLKEGLGITLSVGAHSAEVYKRFFDAGAHRYLLRIETTNRELFKKLHPETQTYDDRLTALQALKDTGFQTGTGVMIGIPGQTIEDLADDILFFKDFDIDMIGMGPYITSLGGAMTNEDTMDKDDLFQLALNMIAVTRLVLPDVNIAATTALQALMPIGREMGISYGANITMPNLTPKEMRKNYQLYEGKPCIDEARADCRSCLERRVQSVHRTVGWNAWGDSKHFLNRQT